MRSITTIIAAAIIATSCFVSCSSKDFDHCEGKLAPRITVDSPVVAGGSIKLSVSGIDNVYMYNWWGPNRFSSHEANPEITNITAASAGRYTVDVITKDGCIYTATTDSIKVGPLTLPCTVPNNYAYFSATSNISFYYVSGNTSGGSYFVEANGSGGDLEMEFAGTNRPVTGIYNIESWGGAWGPGNVRVQCSNNNWLWYANSGNKVYVNTVNGKLVVNLCSVDFTYQSYKSKVSLQVTVP